MNYYEINEDTARRAKQMRSFDDYCEGSATWQYRNRCDEAAALAEQVKAERCKTAAQREHIDYLLNRYCKVLAEATNKDNEIGTRCPSVMISGGGNFPVAKKEKTDCGVGEERGTLRVCGQYPQPDSLLRRCGQVRRPGGTACAESPA